MPVGSASTTALRALVEELHPKVSPRQLSLRAGLEQERLYYHLQAGTRAKGMPKTAAMEEIARALGCDLARVVRACAQDAGLPPWGSTEADLDPREQLLVDRFRTLSREMQDALLLMAGSGATVR